MITANSYQDIQVLQDADFSNTISFDTEYDTSEYSYEAKIAKDRLGTLFNHAGGTPSSVAFTIVKTDATTLTLSLTATQTSTFDDDFEGVWDLLAKKTSNSTFTREIEGDVVISPSVTPKF